ncbi:MAG: hypothetical protein ACK5Q5_21540 [Planctomycetaceae bacterium]
MSSRLDRPEEEEAVWPRRLTWLLRLGAVIEMLALPWVLVPRAWMEHSHEWLGMGPMPVGAVVDFTIRQSAFFYGLHGVLMWLLAGNVLRYRPLIKWIGWTYVLFGPVFFAINWSSGTPRWWTWCDPAVTLTFGLLILLCDQRVRAQHAQSAGSENPEFWPP